jgi:hypothetical protein
MRGSSSRLPCGRRNTRKHKLEPLTRGKKQIVRRETPERFRLLFFLGSWDLPCSQQPAG